MARFYESRCSRQTYDRLERSVKLEWIVLLLLLLLMMMMRMKIEVMMVLVCNCKYPQNERVSAVDVDVVMPTSHVTDHVVRLGDGH